MKSSDYEFNIGDKVVDVYGDTGEIVDICKCDLCAEWGFFEPMWVDSFGEKHWITTYDVDGGFEEFRQIGMYKFEHPFAKGFVKRTIEFHEKMAAQYKERLLVIEEFEKESD